MTWLYVLLVVVVVAAVPGTVWLKRTSDRAWAEHVRRRRQAQITVRLFADTERFVSAMQEAARAIEAFGAAWRTTPRRARWRLRARVWLHRVSRGVL